MHHHTLVLVKSGHLVQPTQKGKLWHRELGSLQGHLQSIIGKFLGISAGQHNIGIGRFMNTISLPLQTVFLSKHVQTIVAGRQKDAQTIKIPGAYTFLGKLIQYCKQYTNTWATERFLCIASAVLRRSESCRSKWERKWLNFCKSVNLSEARFEILYNFIRIMAVIT